MPYSVVLCPRCRGGRIVEGGRKTATCARCGRTLALRDVPAQHVAETLEEARAALGALNARAAPGGEEEYEAAFVPPAPRPERHDDPLDRAAARARSAKGEAGKAEAIARALGEFSEDEFRVACERAGIPGGKASALLERLQGASRVVETRVGRFRSADAG